MDGTNGTTIYAGPDMNEGNESRFTRYERRWEGVPKDGRSQQGCPLKTQGL
jgi:hypothetical protein